VYIHYILHIMNTTQILTDTENSFGRIYLVSNRTHGYYTILPLAKAEFVSFLEELYSDIEVDDYEISYKYLIDANLKDKITSYLHNIFKSSTLTFAINKKMNTSNDFFINLNQLLVNYIRNDELLKNFKLFEITDVCKASVSVVDALEVVEPEVVEPLTAAVTDKEQILPYNHYNTGDTISASLDITTEPIQYFSWKTAECNKNQDIFNKCAILYCVSQSIGIVIENQNTIFVEYLTKNFKDFELIKTYCKLDKKDIDTIKNYFHKKYFDSNETILKKISSFEFLYDINNDKKNGVVNNEIEEYIRERYVINNEPKNLIKANEILGQLMLELQYLNKDKVKLTKELSGILLNMGLKKKRMSDGIYYFGIVSKLNLYSGGNTEEMFKKTVEEHKLEPVSEILTRLKFSCKSRSGPCNCSDPKGCDRVVIPRLQEGFT
jgi:hypothetical protein